MEQLLTIAIDYDNTWTRAPHLMRLVYDHATHNLGHTVIMVTGRHRSDRRDIDKDTSLPLSMPVYFTGGDPKASFMKGVYNIDVDIWVDDDPGKIAGPEWDGDGFEDFDEEA